MRIEWFFALVLAAASSLPIVQASPAEMRPLTVGKLSLPPDFKLTEGKFDLVLHLHGAPETVEKNFRKAGGAGALVNVTLPGLSAVYREKFKEPSTFFALLKETQRAIQDRLNLAESPSIRSVTVSSFSAGFGGVRELLKDEKIFRRIDRLLMADSIYAGFSKPESRTVDPELMSGFARFATLASKGEKVFLLTHSQLETPTYASTVETADFLIASVDGRRRLLDEEWSERLQLVSVFQSGKFEVLGFAGTTGEDHMTHLREIGLFYGRLALLASGANAGPMSEQPAALDGFITELPPESPEARETRHKKIRERRAGPAVIVHRGAWEFAPENTLEAYAAAMDHGADGCEIDIRRTADGVLVMFHDDGLERMTEGLGPLNQSTYAELLRVRFRSNYEPEPDTRIPTFAAVLELARQRAMLLHLDVKEPGLEEAITRLLDAADAWDQVVEINEWNADALRKHPKADRLNYKAFGWQEGRMDMNPEKVREGLAKPGHMIMVDDPRVAALELKRKPVAVSLPKNVRTPWPALDSTASSRGKTNSFSPLALLTSLAGRSDNRSWQGVEKILTAPFPERTDLEGGPVRQQERARRILERAWAAQTIGQLGEKSKRSIELLKEIVVQRSLHRDWSYHGLDATMATRALGELGAIDSAPFLVERFQAVDPELKSMADPKAAYPYVWADYRLKREIICALGELRCASSKNFLGSYLAMDEAAARQFAPPLFEEATRGFLNQEVTQEEVEELLGSKNPAVRGAAILVCLKDRNGRLAVSLRKIMPWTEELPEAKPK